MLLTARSFGARGPVTYILCDKVRARQRFIIRATSADVDGVGIRSSNHRSVKRFLAMAAYSVGRSGIARSTSEPAR